MIRRPPRSTRTDTLFPYTTLFRSIVYNSSSLAGQLAAVESGLAVAVLTQCSVPAHLEILGARHRLGPLEPMGSEEHTSELQSLMRISYAVFCLKKKKKTNTNTCHSMTKQNNHTNHPQIQLKR